MKTLLIIPPLTQINTPYPATAYLKGFLKTTAFPDCSQADLGLELILGIFNKEFIATIFNEAETKPNLNQNSVEILQQRERYENTVDAVILYLQNKNQTLAHKICSGDYLPQASRFNSLGEEVDWLFGSMGIQDKAKYLCTLYIEDLGDLIIDAISADFGFSRYAEDIARSATSFKPIEKKLKAPNNILDQLLLSLTDKHIQSYQPTVVALSIPFPGNLYGAFKIGGHIKQNYPHIKVLMGGGFPNTELRNLSEPAVFDYTDFITLDDGERPILNILEMLSGQRDATDLKRTFTRQDSKVVYINNGKEPDIAHSKTGSPDYTGLLLDKYISILEMANPMHRLWSDGRWNKLTVAHGCYWKRCSFCDISLDYIGRYDPAPASELVDRIEELVKQTGTTGFHFVDEAAPPLALRDLALEILRRKLDISWWANIRFEKTFSDDLCKLLAASGCIAVTGGLEVASDRLLKMMEKGVTVEQVSQVANNFTQSGIMVHAYLMYGFPTQTAQETIDSLEVVRQLFENNVLQSGFWHRFSMTTHSPIGLNPEKYKVKRLGPEIGPFANNDLVHEDPQGCDHDLYSEGLRKSLYNFMHGNCLDWPSHKWFEFKTPRATLPGDLIYNYIENSYVADEEKLKYRLVWIGNKPTFNKASKNTKLSFSTGAGEKLTVKLDNTSADWLEKNLALLSTSNLKFPTLEEFISEYMVTTGTSKEMLLYADWWAALRRYGLLLLWF